MDEFASELVPVRDDLATQIQQAMDSIPEVGEDAWQDILETILSAKSADKVDAPWRSDGLRAMDGKEIWLESISRAPSDYSDGLGWYVILRGVDAETGERKTYTSGSVSVVAQAVRLHMLHALPLKVIPRVSKKPTRNGYYPMHLEIMR